MKKTGILGTITAVLAIIFLVSFTSMNVQADAGHAPEGQVVFTWNYDRSAATASYTCAHCGAHMEESAQVVIDAVEMPTCTEKGTARFVASIVKNGITYSETIYQKDIPALGHSFTSFKDNGNGTCTALCDRGCGASDTTVIPSEVSDETACSAHAYTAVYKWNYDNSACLVHLTCSKCGKMIAKDALVTMDAYTWPTAEYLGTTEYVATVEVDGQIYQEKLYRADIPYTEYVRTHAAPEGTLYATEETVKQAGQMGKVHVTPESAAEETTEETETSASEEETTAEETSTEAESAEEETSSETEEETQAEVTKETEESAASSSAEGTEESAEAQEAGKKSAVSVPLIAGIIGGGVLVLGAAALFVIRKILRNRKHADIKNRIKDQLK